MKLAYQSYGSSILLYINANSNEEAYSKYVSLYNWGATSTGSNGGSWAFDDVDWISHGVIAVWSTIERLQSYLFNIHLMRLLNENEAKYRGVKGGAKDDAVEAALAEFNSIECESYRSINSSPVEYGLGTISAEKPDEDLKDMFISRGLQSA